MFKEITIAGSAHVVDIWGIETGVSHDGDHHMLLHVELSGVKTPGVSESGRLASRKDLLQEFTCRETTIHNKPSATACDSSERAGRTATGQHQNQRKYWGIEC